MEKRTKEGILPKRVKAGYALLYSAPNFQMLLQMYYLVYFYVNILGISGTAAGIIIMVARIWDFINDPIMGVIVEKVRKPQKCLFVMKLAVVPVAIFMILCYSAPQLSYVGKIVWASITFVFLGMSQIAYSIPKDSLQPRLTSNREERARLNVYIRVFSVLLNMLIPTVTMPLIAFMQGFGEVTAFAKVAGIYGLTFIVVTLFSIKLCDGYENDEEIITKKASPKAVEMFVALFKNNIAMLIILLQTVKMLFSSIATAVLVYFCTYNLGNASIQSLISGISGIAGYISILFLVTMFKKFGNAGTGLFGAAFSGALWVVIFVTYSLGFRPLPVIILFSAIANFGGSLVSAVIPQCLMDAIDYGEYKTGEKNTSVIMSAYGIGNKIGLAFGSTIAAFVLDIIHFDAEAVVQPQNVLNAFFHLTVTGQIVVNLVMVVVFIALFRSERKLTEIREAIAARKEEALKVIKE